MDTKERVSKRPKTRAPRRFTWQEYYIMRQSGILSGKGLRHDEGRILHDNREHRFTAAEYHEMARLGILMPDEKVELIDGRIIKMAAIGTPHFNCVNRLTHLFVEQFGTQATASVQNAVHLSNHSEPEPDLALLHRRETYERLPRPDDIFLLVEVADTTLEDDRTTKMPLYARSGIRECWLVNLQDHVVEVYRKPKGRYAEMIRHEPGSSLRVAAFPETELPVDAIL